MTEDFGALDAGMSNAGLSLNSSDLTNLRTAGKWARFIGIVGLASIGLSLLSVLFFGSAMLTMMSAGGLGGDLGGAGIGMGVLLAVWVPVIVLTVYIYWMLYQFGDKAVKAVDGGNSTAIGQSIASLKSLFKVLGIILAVILGIYALLFLVGILGGIFAAI